MAPRGPSPNPAPRLRALTLVATLLLLLCCPSLSDAAAASPSPSPAPAPRRSPPRQVASASGPRAVPTRHPPPKPKRRFNFGERLGIALAGVAVAIQVVLGAFLAVRARQLRRPWPGKAAGAEGEASSSSTAPPA